MKKISDYPLLLNYFEIKSLNSFKRNNIIQRFEEQKNSSLRIPLRIGLFLNQTVVTFQFVFKKLLFRTCKWYQHALRRFFQVVNGSFLDLVGVQF